MSIPLNSACNCCDKIPRFDFSELPPDLSRDFFPFGIRSRTKSASVTPCGVQNPNDGLFYKVYTENYELGSVTRTYTYDPETNNCTEEIVADIPEGGGEGSLISVDYSGQITAGELKGYAETRLGLAEYSEWSNTATPTALSYSDSNGAAIAISEVRGFHPPTFSGFFKMWIDKVTFSWDSDEGRFINPQSGSYDIYEWSGGLLSILHSVNAEENKIYGPTFQLTATDQTQFILFIRKFSFLSDYVPNDPNINLGFDATFSFFLELDRPSPDCFSNGVPTVNESCPASLFD